LYLEDALLFSDLKSVEMLQDGQITYLAIDENQIPETDVVLIAAADMTLKDEGSITCQGVFSINN